MTWLIEQKNSDTIEELTDELLENIIKTNEYVVVYFSLFHYDFVFQKEFRYIIVSISFSYRWTL